MKTSDESDETKTKSLESTDKQQTDDSNKTDEQDEQVIVSRFVIGSDDQTDSSDTTNQQASSMPGTEQSLIY